MLVQGRQRVMNMGGLRMPSLVPALPVATYATRKPAAARADNTPPRFTMRKATRTKYDPVVYDRHAFETRGGVLRELDERERWLGERYVDIMREPAVVFLQSNGLSVSDHKLIKAQLAKNNIELLSVNSRLFKGQLLGTRYHHLAVLLDGPSAMVAWRREQRGVDPVTGAEPPLHADTVAFTRDFRRCLATAPLSVGKRMMVVGAKIERHLLGPRELQAYAALPVAKMLHAELAGVLSSPAQRVASMLQAHPTELGRVLGERVSQLEA